MEDMLGKIHGTVGFIKDKINFEPEYGIVLGTGLSNVVKEMDIHERLPYHKIPDFPVSTVKGHSGELIFGELGGKKVIAMSGRLHYYEGYSMQELTFPVRVMKFLGVQTLFIGSAVGGLNQHIHTGDLVIINDHINLMPEHPLRGKNYDDLGPRFPDLLHTYDKTMVQNGLDIANKHHIRCHTGVYVGVQGPSLETPAEYKYMHRIGGDVVGMSTVPEVLVARHMDMKVFAITVCTDMGYPPEAIQVTTHDDVIEVAKSREKEMSLVMTELITSL